MVEAADAKLIDGAWPVAPEKFDGRPISPVRERGLELGPIASQRYFHFAQKKRGNSWGQSVKSMSRP